MLNSNNLKCIAIICMIIDHIGFFFIDNVDYSTYILCRSIGRIAMPLFIFLLVEGFFYTKNLKKYILRMFIVASITQAIILIFNYIDINYFNNKIPTLERLNILFSFTLILFLLRTIDKSFIENKVLDIFFRSVTLLVIISIYLVVDIDYGIYGALIALTFYILKKINKNIDPFVKYLIQTSLVIIFSILSIKSLIGVFVVFSNIFIMMYNNKRGKKRKSLTLLFYSVFFLQYLLMYLIKLIL